MKNVLIINFTAPELNHLAAFFANKGYLKAYFRPYANKGRVWERSLEQLPIVSRLYLRTLGRRKLPSLLAPSSVREVAILTDFVAAGASRFSNFGIPLANKLAGALQYHIQKKLGRAGGCNANESSAVVASYLVALPAFNACAGLKVLNYPTAHHRYMQKFLAEEAERESEFASTLPAWNAVPAWVAPHLDMECDLADRILVGSNFARDSFIAEGIPADKVSAVPYGVDPMLFSPSSTGISAGDGFRVLFVGQIGQRKGIGYLLNAYGRFRGSGTSLTLVGNCCGREEPLRRYRDLFQHIPNVPRTQLAEIYRRADVFVFPTLIEGLGLVVLEAMATGLPVIVTPNGPGDIVRDGVDGFVVPTRDVDAIVDRMEFLRANPEARLMMGANARERALEFTWDAYGRKVCRELEIF